MGLLGCLVVGLQRYGYVERVVIVWWGCAVKCGKLQCISMLR